MGILILAKKDVIEVDVDAILTSMDLGIVDHELMLLALALSMVLRMLKGYFEITALLLLLKKQLCV